MVMGNIKTCDAHGAAFPNNMVDADKIEIVKLYVERYFTDPTDAKKKIKGTMFVGNNQANEGADVCLACFNEWLASRIAPVGGKISWKKVTWDREEYEKKDGTKGEKLSKVVAEIN